MKYLLDTCVLSETAKPRPQESVVSWLANTEASDLFVPSVVLGEIVSGIEKLDQGRRKDALVSWLEEYKRRFGSMIVPFDGAAAELWGARKAQLEKFGKPRPVVDTQIAAIALARNMTLVTRDEKDFEGFGVRVFNPFESTNG